MTTTPATPSLSSPAPRPRTASLTVARTCALVQTGVAAAAAALGTALAVGSYVADRAAARTDHPNGWAGFGEFLGAAAAVLALAAALMVAVPALRLRPGSAGARYGLIVGEIVTGLPIAFLLLVAINARGQQLGAAAALVWTLCAVITLAALARQRRTSTVPSTPGPR